jgi:hypothetical protein
MRAATFGSFRNTLGSVSIAVETAPPVVGHLIITKLIRYSRISALFPLGWKSWIVTA